MFVYGSRHAISLGAMAYSAPEVLTGKYSAKIDVFSFGVLLIQMCCSEYPRIERREDQLKRACSTHAPLSRIMSASVSFLPEDRPSSISLCEDLKSIRANDRYYPPSRRMSPECDLGVLARRWMNDQIEHRCKDVRLALEQTTRRVEVEEHRWRDEADRVDRAEKKNRELETELALSSDTNNRLTQDIGALQLRLKDTLDALELSKQYSSSLATEKESINNRLMSLLSEHQSASSEMRNQQSALENAQEEIRRKNIDISNGNDKISKLESRERDLTMQLDMQLEHSRELENRLEQALTRWKQEKETSAKETERCSRLRSNCSELVEKNQRISLEMERQMERLKLYDSLPLPEEIKARMHDLDSDLKQKTAEVNKTQTMFEELKKECSYMEHEIQNLMETVANKDENIYSLESANKSLQEHVDNLKQIERKLTEDADREMMNTEHRISEERQVINNLRKELEDVRESQRQDRVALAHALKAKKKNSEGARRGTISSPGSGDDEYNTDSLPATSAALSPSKSPIRSLGLNVSPTIDENEELNPQVQDDATQQAYKRYVVFAVIYISSILLFFLLFVLHLLAGILISLLNLLLIKLWKLQMLH